MAGPSIRFLAFTLAAMSLMGCAAGEVAHPAQTSPQPPASAEARSPGSAPAGAEPSDQPVVDRTAQEEEIIAQADLKFEQGMEALQRGRTDRASELFDEALETYLGSNLLEGGSERLHDSLNRLIDEVADLELDLVPGQSPDAVPSPVEELENIDTSMSPDEAQKELESLGPEVQKITYDIPMVVNDKVLGWIDIFKNNESFRKSFVGGYQRKGWYDKMIHEILGEEGLPADLIYMAFLESTYKTSAYSRARAKGIWQFMAATGRMYGLRIDRYVDERSDPEKATRAMAAYMKDLYAEFGDWHLAMAAYNTGAGNVRRAQRRSGKKDFWDLAKTRYLRRETRNFVPAILALALMEKNPEKYGFEGLTQNPTLEYDEVTVDGPTMLSLVARLAGVTEQDIRFLNPHLRLGVTPPGEDEYTLLVPPGHGKRFTTAYYAMPETERRAKVAKIHKVRRGETLARIARKYGTSVRDLAAANRIRNPHRIREGMELTVPVFPGGGGNSLRYAGVSRSDPYHIVRRGDTLSGIARAYGVPLSRILALNGISKSTVIRPGMRLELRSAAQAETVAARNGAVHRVRRGETMALIARRYGTTVRELSKINGIENPDRIRVGMRLSLPARSGGQRPARRVSQTPPAAPPAPVDARYHVVRRGDTLTAISQTYGVALQSLLSWNGLDRDSVLIPGTRLAVRQDAARTTESARTVRYRIRRGDNLFRIAQKFQTSVEEIKSWNNILDDKIRAGDILTIYPQ